MVDVRRMCKKHLLGEHVECHMFVGSINKEKNLDGYLRKNLFDITKLRKRHDELAKEIVRRGFKHNSPLPEFKMLDKYKGGKVIVKDNEIDLRKRCKNCKF